MRKVKTTHSIPSKEQFPPSQAVEYDSAANFVSSPAGGPATSLDAEETSVLDRPENSYRAFITSGCKREVEAGQRLYAAFDSVVPGNREAAYRLCRSYAYFIRNCRTGEVRVASRRCGLRWCPLCARSLRYYVQHRCREWLQSQKKVRFFTLTLRHSVQPLDFQIDRLFKSWRRLKLIPAFQKRFSGGIWFLQITKSENDGLWHPHLHCLCTGRFLSQKELSDLWLAVTGDSSIVDVRLVRDLDEAADYVARYVSQPVRLSSLSDNEQLEVALCLHGRRLFGTWGTARGVRLRIVKPADADEWEDVGSWTEIAGCAEFDEEASKIWFAWTLKQPYWGPSRAERLSLREKLLLERPPESFHDVFLMQTTLY